MEHQVQSGSTPFASPRRALIGVIIGALFGIFGLSQANLAPTGPEEVISSIGLRFAIKMLGEVIDPFLVWCIGLRRPYLGGRNGYINAITDVPRIRVGHATDGQALTGCTVVLCEKGAVVGWTRGVGLLARERRIWPDLCTWCERPTRYSFQAGALSG